MQTILHPFLCLYRIILFLALVGFKTIKELIVPFTYIDCQKMKQKRNNEDVKKSKVHDKENSKKAVEYQYIFRNARDECRFRQSSDERHVIPCGDGRFLFFVHADTSLKEKSRAERAAANKRRCAKTKTDAAYTLHAALGNLILKVHGDG